MQAPEPSGLAWLELPAGLESLAPLRDFVLDQARAQAMPEEILSRLDLSLEELLVNVFNYAYPPGSPGPVRVGCGVQDHAFRLVLEDYGGAFDPLDKPNPDIVPDIDQSKVGGLGIYLVKEMSDAMRYSRKENANVLEIVFKRRP